jgi:hypothetical protein
MYGGMSAAQEVCKWNVGGGPRCHSGEEIGPVDGIEGVRRVVGQHRCVAWVGAEGGVGGMADVVSPALDAGSELQ